MCVINLGEKRLNSLDGSAYTYKNGHKILHWRLKGEVTKYSATERLGFYVWVNNPEMSIENGFIVKVLN